MLKDKMMVKNKRKWTEMRFIILLSLLVISLNLISASGVVTPYWSDNPLKLAPGESITVQLTLQNMVGQEDISLEATVSGTGVTLLDGPIYNVPLGAEVPVNMRIVVSKNANVGQTYDISVSFTEISTGEGGMLRVASAITTRFPVQVVGETESALYGTKPKLGMNVVWIVLTLVVLALVFFAAQKKKVKAK